MSDNPQIPAPKIPAMPDHPKDGEWSMKRLFRFRRDMFAALPPRLYRAWMAQVRTPFYNSFMMNDPEVSRAVLNAPPRDYPKSDTAYGQIKTLLGENSVFLTNGDLWEMQRRIINPAFEGGRVKAIYPAMQEAVAQMLPRFEALADGKPHDIEFECSHFAADIIFRTLFSVPIEHELARDVFENFQAYQREQPVWSLANLTRMPKFIPRFQSRQARKSAALIRGAIGALVDDRLLAIEAGNAPDDLATKIMTTSDPQTGHKFGREEMIDQVAIFFLAGHETSASALAWALYLLAFDQDVQARVYEETKALTPDFQSLTALKITRNVFSETLRLYAPVPMMVREATKPASFRERNVKPGDLCIISAWHSGRHERIWEHPHEFRPDRFDNLPAHCREAYFPFSAGGRICMGAGFALIEGLLGISSLISTFEFSLGDEKPVPVAHLTTRSKSGISLRIAKRAEHK